jgi:hypothetical protein
VDGRDKPGQGEFKEAKVTSKSNQNTSLVPNRTVVGQSAVKNRQAIAGCGGSALAK